MRNRAIAAGLALVLTSLVAVSAVLASGNTGYVPTGAGYSWGYTYSVSLSCSPYYCTHSKTYNYDESYHTEDAAALQASTAGWNCDLYCHCVDLANSYAQYDVYVVSSPNAYLFDSSYGNPPKWGTSLHMSIPYGESGTWSYSSSDGSHDNSAYYWDC